jgi:hypothetical protein
MSVGGVSRIGSSVGTIVGVLISVGVTVGKAVKVKVNVGVEVDIWVESSITGTGAACARGVQALRDKNKMIKKVAMRFTGLPPGDEMNCCFNGSIYLIVPKIMKPSAKPDR